MNKERGAGMKTQKSVMNRMLTVEAVRTECPVLWSCQIIEPLFFYFCVESVGGNSQFLLFGYLNLSFVNFIELWYFPPCWEWISSMICPWSHYPLGFYVSFQQHLISFAVGSSITLWSEFCQISTTGVNE